MSNRQISVQTNGLSIGYLTRSEKKVIAENLNLSLFTGEVTCLLGFNGVGKSTLLRTLCGFQPALNGKVLLFGKPSNSFSQSEFSLNVGVVLTEKTNAGGITVYDLVSLGRHPYTGFFGQLKKIDHTIIMESLEASGIAHKSSCYVSQLSDGERQRAMIAKVLAQQCKVVVLDEPTAFLDVASRTETMVLLRNLARNQGKTILLSTHDLDLAVQMGDRLWLMRRKEDSSSAQMVCGTPEDLILSGTFGEYFDKQGITFDSSTGKFITSSPVPTIRVEGDALTVFWVRNALMRNGFNSTLEGEGCAHVVCTSPRQIEICLPNGTRQKSDTLEEMIYALLSLCEEGGM